MVIEDIYKIRDDETDEEYQYRISSIRDDKRWTWQEVADIINDQTGNSFSESKYRKDWRSYCAGYKAGTKDCEIIPEYEELIAKKIDVEKARVKLSDERVQTNAYIRQLAREETIKEIAQEAANKVSMNKPLPEISISKNEGKNEAILCISDWHYGLECDNYWNKYNPDIARERVARLLQSTIDICQKNGVKRIHVVNLADLICGRIHLTLRLESRFDVITQTIEVSEILAEFLNKLAGLFDVEYYDCIDNHSRLEPNKKNAMDLESLARVIPWYLKTRIGNKIHINDNVFGEDIITFKVFDFNIIGVHGDKDGPSSVVPRLSLMTRDQYDMVLTAHLHHFSADEQNETLVVSNGSLMGTDTYAKNLRLSSIPSQNLIIVEPGCVAASINRITLKD